MTSSQQPETVPTHHSIWQQPLVIAAGIVLAWVILVIASDQMWQHAFGFPGRDAWALAIGLLAYVALMAGAIGGIIWIMGHEHQHYQ